MRANIFDNPNDLPILDEADIGDSDSIVLLSQTQGASRMLLNDLRWGRARITDFTISSAQLLALNTTPITVLPAVANYYHLFTGAALFLDYNSAAYAGIAAGEDLAFRYTDGSGAIVGEVETTGFLDATADARRWCYSHAVGATLPVTSITPVAASPLVLHLLSGNITTGNSPLYGRIWSRLIPSTLP